MLKNKIIEKRNFFLKDHNKIAADILSFALSEIKNAEINNGKRDGLPDCDVIALLQKSIKKMQEAKNLFLKGNRNDLADKEDESIKILQEFLPTLLNEAETEKLVTKILINFDNPTIKDMGKIMTELKDRSDVDKSLLSKIIKTKLQ